MSHVVCLPPLLPTSAVIFLYLIPLSSVKNLSLWQRDAAIVLIFTEMKKEKKSPVSTIEKTAWIKSKRRNLIKSWEEK